MKTKEFIKKVKELGYETFEGVNMLYIRVNGITLGFVGLKKMYYMNLEVELKGLFDLCVEYAKTPLTEREEEEKFYLKKMESFYDENYDEENAYLNFEMSDGDFLLESINENNAYKTQFTQKEIDKIKEEQHTDLSEFEQIPVEED